MRASKQRQTQSGPARLLAAAALALGLAGPAAVAAQELAPPSPHQGYYLSLGVYAVGDINRDSDRGWYGPWPGVGGSVRMGEALTDWIDLGLGIGINAAIEERWVATIGHVALEAQLRPRQELFFRLSAGFGFADFTRRKHGIDKPLGRIGGSYGVAVGWDFFPAYDGGSGGFAVTPVVWFEAGPSDTFSTLSAGVGIEISWWTGRPRSQLELPLEEAFGP
jgi:hypothetical protein